MRYIFKHRLTAICFTLHGWYLKFSVFNPWYLRILVQGTMLIAGTSAAFADSLTPLVDQKEYNGISEAPKPSVKEDVSLNYSYVGSADLKSGLQGNLGEQTTQFGYSLMAPLNERLSLQLGLNYNRLDFGQPAGSPLPYNLQTVSVSLGLSYKLSDEWSVFGAVMPRLELIDNADQIESQSFEVGGAIGATYDFNPDLSLRFGLGINPGALGIPVVPMVGVRWHFAKPWTLNVGFPRTSLDYQLLPNLRLSPIEVGFQGGSFHTSKTYGDSVGMSKLNDRNLDYNEVRVGAGADYAVMKNVNVELTGGAVVYREFDFDNANFSPKVDPAPYVQLGIKVGF